MLAAIADCAEACRGTLRELDGERDRLRAALDRRIRPAPDGPTRRLCAVDGSNATVPAAGATFAAIAAAAVEEDTLTDQDVLVRLLPPIKELDSILVLDDFRERRAAIERGYGQLYVTYYRPDSFGPAYRLELPAALLAREPLGAVLATFRGALRVSSIQEPLPQFLADAICRQLGHALAATTEGTRTTLQGEFELALVQRYLGPYRTPRR